MVKKLDGVFAAFIAFSAFLVFFIISATLSAHAQLAGVTLPSVPGSVTATLTPPLQVFASWSASTESSGTILGYYVYRNNVQIGTTGNTSLLDTGLLPGYYAYTVAAYDANGIVSNQSAAANISVSADTAPPSIPAGVSASAPSSTNSSVASISVAISWTASTDNIAVAGYKVFRNGTAIGTTTATTFTDTVAPGGYAYTIEAYDTSQNFSQASQPAAIGINLDATPPTTPTNLSVIQMSETSVRLAWQASTDNVAVTGYQISRNGSQIATASNTTYIDLGLSALNNYQYYVIAYDASGNLSGQSNAMAIRMVDLMGGPTMLYAPSAVLAQTSSVRLSWIAASDIVPIASYIIYRNSAQIGTATGTSYIDSVVASGTYAYTVTATDSGGAVSSSSPATTVVATPSAFAAAAANGSGSAGSVAPASSGGITFTLYLYYGSKNAQVAALQSLLISQGYLKANATGFFGSLTLAALKKFQCDHSIACTANPAGWGLVGPKTRAVLNSIH